MTRWMSGLVLVVCGCSGPSPIGGGESSGGDFDPIEGTGERWGPEETGEDEDEPPPMADDPDCSARWLDSDAPRVLVDAEFDCRTPAFANFGVSVASQGDAAIAILADSDRAWVVRVADDVVAPIPGGPEVFDRQRVHTTTDADGALVVTGTTRRDGEQVWEVWTRAGQWSRLAKVPVGAGTTVTGVDASAGGDIAVWLDVGGTPTIARARDAWAFKPAAELGDAVRTSSALSPDGAEVVVGYSVDEDAGTAQLLGRVDGETVVPLGSPAPAPIELSLAARAAGRVFPLDSDPLVVLSGTLDELAASWPGDTIPVPEAAMASVRCPSEWGAVDAWEDCEDCTEQGSGRFGQAAAVARTDAGTLLVAYVRGVVDRQFDYNFWCTNPDGAFCSCETQFWDRGSSFELRLLAVRSDGTLDTLLATPLVGIPDERESTQPGDMVDLDARGDRAALAVRLADEPVRVLVVDTSGIDTLAG